MDNNLTPPQDLPGARQHKILLFDFYGNLLTQRQREVFTMHHMEDCSLAEIAEAMGITPQAVADMLKRTAGRLFYYEKQLGLMAKLENQRTTVAIIRLALRKFENPETALIGELVDSLLL